MLPNPAFHVRDQRVINRVRELTDFSSLSQSAAPDVDAPAPVMPASPMRLRLDSGLFVRIVFPTYDVALHVWNSLGFRADLDQPTPETLLLKVPTGDSVRYKQIMHTIAAVPDVAIDSIVNVIDNPPASPMAPATPIEEKKRERSWDHSHSSSQSS